MAKAAVNSTPEREADPPAPGPRPPPPAVSVVIPTRNPGARLAGCLEAVRAALPPSSEVLVVDSRSTDGSLDAAVRYGAHAIVAESSITRARLIGARAARGEYVVNLDVDQRLKPGAVAAALATGADVIALGESSAGRGLVAAANRLHNRRVHATWSGELEAGSGGIVPRMYRRSRLVDALERIPDSILDVRPCPYAEDSLIYWSATRDRPTTAFVPDAVVHEEVASVTEYLRKWFQYGVTAKAYRGTAYAFLLSRRGSHRLRGAVYPSSVPALLLRGPSFLLGYFL